MTEKTKDPSVFHGHHVVTGPELRAAFTEPDGATEDPGRRWRHIVHNVVLGLLLVLIVAAGLVAAGILQGRIKLPAAVNEPGAATSLCPAATFDYVPPESVSVNVYNSTNRSGLAQAAADALLARRFQVATIGNSEATYRGVAAVVSGAGGQAGAFTLQRHLPGSDYFQDGRTDASVDVVISSEYSDLAPADLVDQTPGQLSCPRETRRIADPAPWPVIQPPPPGQG